MTPRSSWWRVLERPSLAAVVGTAAAWVVLASVAMLRDAEGRSVVDVTLADSPAEYESPLYRAVP